MKHYRQTTGRAAEKFYEQAAGQNDVQEFAHVHAGIGRTGVENGKNTCVDSCTSFPIFQGRATRCPTIQGLGKKPLLRDRDSNPD